MTGPTQPGVIDKIKTYQTGHDTPFAKTSGRAKFGAGYYTQHTPRTGTLAHILKWHIKERVERPLIYIAVNRRMLDIARAQHGIDMGLTDLLQGKASAQMDSGGTNSGNAAFDKADPDVLSRDITSFRNMHMAHACSLGRRADAMGPFEALMLDARKGGLIHAYHVVALSLGGRGNMLPRAINLGIDRKLDHAQAKMLGRIDDCPAVSSSNISALCDLYRAGVQAYRDEKAAAGAAHAGLVEVADYVLSILSGSDGLYSRFGGMEPGALRIGARHIAAWAKSLNDPELERETSTLVAAEGAA